MNVIFDALETDEFTVGKLEQFTVIVKEGI